MKDLIIYLWCRLLLLGILGWNELLVFRCWLKGGDTAALREALSDELLELLHGGVDRETRLKKLRGE